MDRESRFLNAMESMGDRFFSAVEIAYFLLLLYKRL